MEVQELEHFEELLQTLYNNKDEFTIKRSTIKGKEVVKANFVFKDFEFELFGQAQPVHKQNAYLHMIIEHELLQKVPNLKQKVINLKKQGYKTEPAFFKRADPIRGKKCISVARLLVLNVDSMHYLIKSMGEI